jgi:hypothetical protein
MGKTIYFVETHSYGNVHYEAIPATAIVIVLLGLNMTAP